MIKTFADTFYYLAVLNPSDAAHERALEITAHRTGKLITTHWILTEVADAMAHPEHRARFSSLMRSLESDRGTIIVPATAKLFRDGISLFEQRPDKSWSLTDCISFVVMDQHNVKEVLTGDHHFAQAGFAALLA